MLHQVLNEPHMVPGVRSLEIDESGTEDLLLQWNRPQAKGYGKDGRQDYDVYGPGSNFRLSFLFQVNPQESFE